jgi:hypothetical protein
VYEELDSMRDEDRYRTEHRGDPGITVKRLCRSPLPRRVPLTLKELFPHVRILTDPNKLALLKAEAARRKQIAGRSCKAKGHSQRIENRLGARQTN